MVTFDHRDEGTREAEWSASSRWASVPWSEPRGVEHAIVIAAHPDDETLGAGALLARLHRRGTRVTVVLATRGEAAYAVDVSHLRIAEFHAALARVAPDCTVIDLGLVDGGLESQRHELESAIEALDAADLIVAPWRGDGHGDHEACGSVAARLAATWDATLLEYPIWLWHWARPADSRVPWGEFVRVPVGDEAAHAKRSALESYASQSTADGRSEPILHANMLAHFARGWETFVRSTA